MYAILNKNGLRERLYKTLTGWTLNPRRAALSTRKPSISATLGRVVRVSGYDQLIVDYPAGQVRWRPDGTEI